MKSVFARDRPRHVESFKYNVVRYEEMSVQQSYQEDHSVMGHERTNMAQVPFELKDLFKERRIKVDGPTKDIRKILLVGNPGTGWWQYHGVI